MFSFLSPLSLWLGALLAVPLVIHFLGRQRLRKEPFPSLMLLEERFARSMQRHRLKNLLLLILRTLLILCLFLALANPALETAGGGGAEVGSAAAVVHNGAYGLLPAAEGGLAAQRRLLASLDSLAGTRVRAVPLLEDGAGLSQAAARHGDYREAAERALAALDPGAASAALYLPVYAWADLEAARDALAAALRERPGLQLVLWDFGAAGARLTAFSAVAATPSSRNPTVTLRAVLNPLAGKSGSAKVRALVGSRVLQESPAGEGGIAEIVLPLGDGARTSGRLTAVGGPERAGFAVMDWHFAFPNPGRLTLAHVGSALASLPSLGRDNYFRRIVHVPSARDIPWAGAPGAAPAGSGPASGASPEPGSLRLVYLSNERNTDAAAYGRIVEFVKRGGRLVVGVGRESDIPLLNRFLLQPLRMGRLGSVVDAGAGGKAEADPRALARLGGLPAASGSLGLVRKRFAFTPDSGTAVLVSQGGGPVLALREFHAGRILLWTTDLDDLEWSDVGVAPLVPLLHQAFQEGAGGLTANRAVASDSVLEHPLEEEGGRAEVLDPEGRPFTRVRADGTRLRIGPFDRPGLHAVVQGGDTAVFAVNLEPRGPLPASGEEWEDWNVARREDVLRGLGEFRGRVQVTAPEAGGYVRAAVRPLWRAFFLAAILLLFLEGLIASAFSPDPRGRQAA